MKNKFVNLRFPVVLACTLALGVLTGFLFIFYGLDPVWFLAAVPVLGTPLAIFAFKANKKLLILTTVIAVLFVCGTTESYYYLKSFKSSEISEERVYHVCGTVDEKKRTDYGEYVILKNATADGEALGGKLSVTLSYSYGEFCDIGYRVEFDSALTKHAPFVYGKLSYYAQKNIKYGCSVSEELESEYGFSPFGAIRARIRDTLYENLDKDTAAVCYGMILGDTSDIGDETLENIRYGGVAHVFAVSGLHIGIVYAILSFIFKKIGANKRISSAFSILAVLFYSGVCGFTLSSVRAVIMCGVTALTGLIHVKRDGLNSLSFAVIIILLITPVSLFTIGFQLSVCAVGGIMLFSCKLSNLLTKLRIPKAVAGSVALSLGATAGTLPVSAAAFGYVSGAGFILNIVLIPLLSALFEIIFITTIICAIIPPLGAAIYYIALPLDAVLSFLISAGFEKALITGLGGEWFILFYNLTALTVSDKFNFRPFARIIAFTFAMFVTALYAILQTASPFSGYKIIASANNSGGLVLFKSSQGNVLVITENQSAQQVTELLDGSYAMNLEGIIIIGSENSAVKYDRNVNCKDVYLSNFYIPLQPYAGTEFHYEQEFELCGIEFELCDGYTLKARVIDKTVLICAGYVPEDECDILISQNLNYSFDDLYESCTAQKTVYFSQKGIGYSIYDYGKTSFYFK